MLCQNFNKFTHTERETETERQIEREMQTYAACAVNLCGSTGVLRAPANNDT